MRDFGWAVTQAADLPAPRSLGSFLRDFDVIVACTGASGHLIPAQALEEAAAHRGTPLVVLDLSMPRDVDPSARHIDGVLLFDVDALPAMAETAVASRRAGVADAKRIVDEELDRFGAWRADQILAPTIKALRNHVRDVLVDALDQSPGAEADAATVERIVGRILHTPTRRMREATADARGAESVRLLRWLFDVDGRGTP
jgi:glutamyl-tRNA reductase